ncbi:MAG: TetR/AcrR family transcriptional regulator [Muribaculaceae bacterium]
MELKTRIVTTTLQMMMQMGVSSMTMDAIARSCGISKRTLYEQFPDKITLLSEAFKYDFKAKQARLEKIFNNSSNRIEALLSVYSEIRKQVSHTSIALVSDIRRLYPSLYSEYEAVQNQNNASLVEVLKQGRDEGLVRNDANIGITVQLFTMIVRSTELSNLAYRNDLPLVKVLDELFINFMRSIATIRGIEMIDEFITSINDNNNIIINKNKDKQ